MLLLTDCVMTHTTAKLSPTTVNFIRHWNTYKPMTNMNCKILFVLNLFLPHVLPIYNLPFFSVVFIFNGRTTVGTQFNVWLSQCFSNLVWVSLNSDEVYILHNCCLLLDGWVLVFFCFAVTFYQICTLSWCEHYRTSTEDKR